MKILFDFRVYQIGYDRGMGRYIYNLVKAIIKNDVNNDIDITFFLDEDKKIPEFNTNKDLKYIFSQDLDKVEIKEKFDFWFFDDFLYPCYIQIKSFFDDKFPEKIRQNCKRIVGIMHDFIPLVFAKDYLPNFENSLYFYNFFNIKVVDFLFCNSKYTKQDLIKFLPEFKDKSLNIYGGADLNKFNNNKEYNFKERLNNIICVPGADYRKNPQGLIEAFGVAYNSGKISKNSKLYICCKLNKNFREFLKNTIQKSNLTNKQVILTDYIEDDKLVELLRTAKATFFPSFYEGLGLPIIESYACNTPSFASNRSSTKEFVLPECSFNPYDISDIADKIIKSLNDEELCNKSVKFGKKLIENEVNWDIASKKVIEKLKELNTKMIYSYEKNTAVFGALPPETTGLAPYNANTFGINEKYDVFSDFANVFNFEYAQTFLPKNDYTNNFFPIELYGELNKKYNYKKKIFVLGNSIHNILYLQKAINEIDKQNSWLYLHEALLLGLLIYFFDWEFSKIKNILIKFYPKISPLKTISEIIEYCRDNNILCVIPILSLTNIKNIIVNSESCKNLILNEIKNYKFDIKLNFIVAFHPLLKLKNIEPMNLKNSKNQLIIGSFGYCDNKYKLTDIIIKSIQILNENYNMDAKLVLAGFNINEYLNSIECSIVKKYIIAIDSPSEDKLFSIMRGVDIAVQLRNYDYGASSGCICQLLSLNKTIIATKNIISNSEFFEKIYIVEGDIKSKELALKIIENVKNKKDIDNQDLIDKFSYKNLSNILLTM